MGFSGFEVIRSALMTSIVWPMRCYAGIWDVFPRNFGGLSDSKALHLAAGLGHSLAAELFNLGEEVGV